MLPEIEQLFDRWFRASEDAKLKGEFLQTLELDDTLDSITDFEAHVAEYCEMINVSNRFAKEIDALMVRRLPF